jgi:hypothetical protein
MRRFSLGGMSLLAVMAMAACSDSVTDTLGDLTADEAEALAEVVGQTVMTTWSDPGTAAGGPAPIAAIIIESDFEGDAPCPLGGQVAMSGDLILEIDDETEDMTFDYSVTQVHQNCAAASEDGIVFTLNGAPNVSATLFVQALQDTLSFSSNYSGAVDWSTQGRSGTCSLSVQFSFEMNATTEAGSGSMTGTVCGHNFSQTVSFS